MFILFKTYWWSIGTKYIFEKNLVDATSKRPIDILETNCLIGCIWKYSFLKWILKTSFDRRFTKTSIIICICLWQYALKLSWRRFKNIFKLFWRCLEEVLKTHDQDCFCRYSSWSRRLEDVLETNSKYNVKTRVKDDFEKSSRRLY